MGRKFISATIVLALAIGVAATLMIAVYVRHEFSHDRFHENAERVYRLTVRQQFENGERIWQQSAWFMGPRLAGDYPYILDYVRFFRFNRVIQTHERQYHASGYCVDANVFDLFTFPLVEGDPRIALKEPNSIVITESLAGKLFGDEDPMHKVVKAGEFKGKAYFLTVTGVLRDIPRNSHLSFDYLFSINTVTNHLPNYLDSKGWMSVYTYVLLAQGYTNENFEVQERDFIQRFYGRKDAQRFQLSLQSLTDLHLDSPANQQFSANAMLRQSAYVHVFLIAAVLVLIGACLNVFNLNAAAYLSRAREIGIRKVIGAKRSELAFQILVESFAISSVSVLAGVGIAYLCFPYFNSLAFKGLYSASGQISFILVTLLALVFITGIGIGGFPARWVSGIQPTQVEKGQLKFDTAKWLQYILLPLQFAVSTFFLSSAAVVFLQMDHIDKKNLGYSPEGVFYFSTPGLSASQRLTIERELKDSPSILNVASGGIPGGNLRSYTARGRSITGGISIRSLAASIDYLPTLGIALRRGRNFTTLHEVERTCLLNETAVRLLGLEAPIGEEISWWGQRRTVVGVVRDYHFMSLHNPIEPLGIFLTESGSGILVRIHPDGVDDAVEWIRQTWSKVAPRTAFPTNSGFLVDRIERLYRNERALTQVVSICVFLVLFLSGLGLLGFVRLMVEQETRDIGIRKVVGASEWRVAARYVRKFAIMGIIGALAACPVAYYVLTLWLQGFAYRIQIGVDVFVYATLLTTSIAILIAGGQAYRTSLMNPVTALREE